MFTNKHPWQNFDEIQTLWRLGRFDRPPIPENIPKEAISFLNQTFETDPEKRATAESLFQDKFCIQGEFDFKQYKEKAIIRKQQQDLAEEADDDDESDGDECEEENSSCTDES